jgi:predicted nucleic acid-binding protein
VLLDVNVLIALAWPNHIHHLAALDWFHGGGRRRFATCPATQAGFIPISSNTLALPDARSPQQTRKVLRRITALAGHSFWSDDVDLSRDEVSAARDHAWRDDGGERTVGAWQKRRSGDVA